MSKETKKLDFNGQVFFIGIDTHKNNWKVNIRTNGMSLKTFCMDPDPKGLYSYMNKNYPGGQYFSAYEAGYSGFWIHRDLVKLGIRNIIVNPADVPGTHKEKDRKDDAIDSNKLSRELGNGSLTGICVPDEYREAIRNLSRTLIQYGRRSTQVKCRIKALLSFLGMDSQIDVKQRWSAAYLKVLSELRFKQPANEFVLRIHLKELGHIRRQRLELLREIRKISNGNEILKLLRSIPGVGMVTAFVLYAELISMDRFESMDKLASMVGLVPSTQSSDKKVIVKGISMRHSRHLRYILVEAAWVAVRTDPVFTHSFELLCRRMTKQRAIIRMAKKLLNRIRSVWKNRRPYELGTIEVVKVKKEDIPKLINKMDKEAQSYSTAA